MLSKQFLAQNLLALAKAIMVLSNDNLDKRAERQMDERRFKERGHEYQPAGMQVIKASMRTQLKEIQLLICFSDKSYIQMAVSVSSKGTTKNTWTKVTGKKPKPIIPQKVKPQKTRIIFWKIVKFPQKSEVNLMLVLNKVL